MKKSLTVVAVVALLAMASLAFAAGYKDVPANSIYLPAIEALTKAKIMMASNGMFDGTATVNRYQLAETAYKLLNYIENDPMLVKAKDMETLQAVINSVVKKMGSNDALIANLQKEVNSLKVVVSELQKSDLSQIVAQNAQSISTLQNMLVEMQNTISQAAKANTNAKKALDLTHINNMMIANQAKELASLKQDMKALKSMNYDAEIAKVKGELEAELNQTAAFIYKKITVATQPISKNTKEIANLKSQIADLQKKMSDNSIAWNTSISSIQNSLSNQINFVGNDLKMTKSQLSSEINNTKIGLKQEIAKTDAKANIALWTGVAGIVIGALGFGTFLYWVWEQQ